MSEGLFSELLPVPLFCGTHVRSYYSNDAGTCENCRNRTTSRKFRLCTKCSQAYGLCCVCRTHATAAPPPPIPKRK